MTIPDIEHVRVSAKAAARLRSGHPWVFSGEIRDAGGARDGDIVLVEYRERKRTKILGCAFYNSQSMIACRLIEKGEVPVDREFWIRRLERAFELRRGLGDGDEACRLVFAESDGIPGLVVDRFGDVAVVQTLCAGTEKLKALWVELLRELGGFSCIVERNDSAARKLEGLEQRTGILDGKLDGPLEVKISGVSRTIEPLGGQKTGAYLDQRYNHRLAARWARGRCLDAFSYQGGFGLPMAQAGAEQVVLLDQSERALEVARRDAERNGLSVECRQVNVFDELRKLHKRGERFDTIVLDPPAFAKNRQAVESAWRGYKEINLRAMRLLAQGGILVSCSCSYHVSEQMFEQVLQSAAGDAGRRVQVVVRAGAGPDHPERLGFPESRYLKCFVCRVL
ncbi:MAG: class I SAM-dependent rRNA methyltransferase [Deltaproteobacteria bacterium]|nr:MAG: class I SAM-dependent rRNA methyltransferase [Deltaproteobacteria bacterium]